MKNDKSFLYTTLAIVATLLLAGVAASFDDDRPQYTVVEDRETHCQYLKTATLITPRLDKDGKIICK